MGLQPTGTSRPAEQGDQVITAIVYYMPAAASIELYIPSIRSCAPYDLRRGGALPTRRQLSDCAEERLAQHYEARKSPRPAGRVELQFRVPHDDELVDEVPPTSNLVSAFGYGVPGFGHIASGFIRTAAPRRPGTGPVPCPDRWFTQTADDAEGNNTDSDDDDRSLYLSAQNWAPPPWLQLSPSGTANSSEQLNSDPPAGEGFNIVYLDVTAPPNPARPADTNSAPGSEPAHPVVALAERLGWRTEWMDCSRGRFVCDTTDLYVFFRLNYRAADFSRDWPMYYAVAYKDATNGVGAETIRLVDHGSDGYTGEEHMQIVERFLTEHGPRGSRGQSS